jgi:predicted nucleotidyltransferase
MKPIALVHNKTASVVESLAELEGVQAILCFGSYAMGTFDEYSDLDLFVFCEPEVVSASERKQVLESIQGVTHFEESDAAVGWDPQWCPQGDNLRVNADLFEISYNTMDWIRTVVRRVTQEGAISIPEQKFRPYTMLGLLENGIILYDPCSCLRHLIDCLYPYPTQLKQRLISDSLHTLKDCLAELKDGVKRGFGLTFFHFFFHRMRDALHILLFAVNEKYDPAVKRSEVAYEKLSLLPPNFLERYTKLLEGPFDRNGRQRVIHELETLVVEIEILITESISVHGGKNYGVD